ncbi:MAG TPA: LuxR C-terminal-related transcriptional regulator [Streptosporangiaceae bacterium]|nr:LuxR C-terminal-related transcriptional regulator [Streptosporangiaceae bacterium]
MTGPAIITDNVIGISDHAAGRLLSVTAPAFVGREKEAAALEEALTGPPTVVLVEGEAGIGKSRLLHEVLARPSLRRRISMVSTCPPLRQPCTLGPVVDALRQVSGGVRGLGLTGLAGTLRPLFPEWSADLPPAPERLDDATAARHRLFSALSELLAGLGVAVLIVEDVHCADEATLEFLLFLRTQRAHPSIVVTYRPEDVPDDSLLLRLSSRLSSRLPSSSASSLDSGDAGLRLSLPPLAVNETASLVSSMLHDSSISPTFAVFLHERTDGVPLAVEELVRLMHDRSDISSRAGEWVRRSLHEIAVPDTIRDGVLERCRRLTRDACAVLNAVSVLADRADEEMLRAVAGLPAGRAAAALAEVLRCGLLTEDERSVVSFRHGLAAQAVYEAMSPPERRRLHLRAGHALEDRPCPPIAQLTRHFREAGESAKWCCYAEQAADLALATGDQTTASALLHDLLTNAELPVGPVVRLIKKVPFASFTGHEPVRDLAHTLRAVLDEGVADLADEADARMLLARVLLVLADREAARAELERAIPHLRHDTVEAARAAILLGWPQDMTWPASLHRQWLDRAADLSASMPPDDRLNLTVERASAMLMLGDEAGWTVAAGIPEDVARPGEQQHVVKAHLNIGSIATAWGRDPEGRRRLTKAVELIEAHEYWLYRDMVTAALVHLDWLAGAWDGLAERAARLADSPEVHPLARLEAVLVRGLLYAATGEEGRAVRDLRRVLGEAKQRAAVDTVMEPAAALARLWLAGGRVEDALRVTEQAVTILARKQIWVWATDIAPARVDALVTAGRVDEAEELTAAFARGLHGRDAPAPKAALLFCQALVAGGRVDHARAAGLFARAAKAWRDVPRPYQELLARERQAASLLAAGPQAAAPRASGQQPLTILTDVLNGLSGLGARGDALRVIRVLNEHGVSAKRPWLGGRRSYGGELSPREIDVVRLVLGGRTNRQIAEALFLSPKTVACHVYSAMRKFNVANRAALAARALETGLSYTNLAQSKLGNLPDGLLTGP